MYIPSLCLCLREVPHVSKVWMGSPRMRTFLPQDISLESHELVHVSPGLGLSWVIQCSVTLLFAVLVLVNTKPIGHPLVDTHLQWCAASLFSVSWVLGHAASSEISFLSPRSFIEVNLEDGHRPTTTASCGRRTAFLGNLLGTSKILAFSHIASWPSSCALKGWGFGS